MIEELPLEESHSNLGMILNKADVVMEEKKMEAKESKKMKIQNDEMESDDSGEGVDSDDLDDEIEDNVEQLVMQKQ